MKPISLQLLTVDLENGTQGVFIGVPLVTEELSETESQIEEIWFSDIHEVPENITVADLIQLVREQSGGRKSMIH